MSSILETITEWLKELLISGIMGNLTGVFDSVNSRVGEIARRRGMTPANFSPGIFAMIRNVSESVIIPIAGLILTFIACYELIQLIIEHNNLANFETWVIFKWIFKTFVAVTLISNCFNIVMAVFDVCQTVIARSGGLIGASTAISGDAIAAMEATLQTYDLGPLLGHLPDELCDPDHPLGPLGGHLRHRLRAYDRDLFAHQHGAHPAVHLWQPGAEPGRAELTCAPCLPSASRLPHHYLCRQHAI